MQKFWTLFLVLCLGYISGMDACTRALYVGDDNLVITGRSMDWSEDMRSNLWVFPRGIQRISIPSGNSFTWVSKYGSLIASGYDLGTADGMNEKGLVVNLLYLAESDYGTPSKDKHMMSISLWGQYVLDTCATVAEAVQELAKDHFTIVAQPLPNGKASQLHLAISDPTGDSAIFEYIAGKLVVHHGKEYVVMTNSPIYHEQLAINKYWESIGGFAFLPGTSRAADRYARASFFLSAVPKKMDGRYASAIPDHSFTNQAVAEVMSIMRSIGGPLGIVNVNSPNISSTIWRTVADQKHKVYYFDSALTPNTFWVPLADLNFKEGAPVKKLELLHGKVYSGNAAKKFVKTKPFVFR